MRTWSLCAIETLCGKCRKEILFGHPMQTITSDPARNIKATKVRCVTCAEGAPPKDLPPPVVDAGPKLQPMKPLRSMSLPLDYKHKASGGDR